LRIIVRKVVWMHDLEQSLLQEVLDISRNHANYFLREAVGATQIQAWKNPPLSDFHQTSLKE
jgi:hypothetical protein